MPGEPSKILSASNSGQRQPDPAIEQLRQEIAEMKEHLNTLSLWQEKQLLERNLADLEDELKERFNARKGLSSDRISPRKRTLDPLGSE